MNVFILLCGFGVVFYTVLLTALYRDGRRRRRAMENPARTVKLGAVFAMNTASPGRPALVAQFGGDHEPRYR